MIFGDIAEGLLGKSVHTIFKRLIPNREARKEAERDMEAAIQSAIAAEVAAQAEVQQAQLRINQAEATHRTMFVAGWRPFIGWTCGVALAFILIIEPLASWGLVLAGKDIALPEFDKNMTMLILGPMLGIGGMRTVEKLQGKAR